MKTIVKIIDNGDYVSSLCVGIQVAKVLNFDHLAVEFDGFSVGVSKESKITDVSEIWRLKNEIIELKSKKKLTP